MYRDLRKISILIDINTVIYISGTSIVKYVGQVFRTNGTGFTIFRALNEPNVFNDWWLADFVCNDHYINDSN